MTPKAPFDIRHAPVWRVSCPGEPAELRITAVALYDGAQGWLLDAWVEEKRENRTCALSEVRVEGAEDAGA